MDNMPICQQCQQPLLPDAPEGLCPRCLGKMALDSEPAIKGTRIPPDPAELAKEFPQLEIIALLGMGGMGVVYKARQPSLDRLIALKILSRDAEQDLSFAERFSREAKALAKLNHPGIVAIYDFGQTDQHYYFMMEYVEGTNLRQLLQSQTISPGQALGLVTEISTALQYAHDEGIVHRDIKPENILVNKRGHAKIADFGLAKLLDTDTDASLTASQTVMGSINYMAPEQREKPLTVDHRADIYSLGVVFYEMLTGELPIGRFAPPSRKVRVDVRLDEVVLRTLEKEPDLRYQKASEVKTAIETVDSRTASRPSVTKKHPILLLATLCIILVLAFAGWFVFHPKGQPIANAPKAKAHLLLARLSRITAETGLVCWWKADGDALDSAGNHHGTLMNGVNFDSGIEGQAFRFNGLDTYVSVPDDPAWAFGTNDFSIALWAKMFFVAGRQGFIASDDGNGDRNKWVFWLDVGQLRLILRNQEGTLSTTMGNSAFLPETNRWYHFAVTRHGNSYRFYVDGAEVARQENSWPVPRSTQPLTIGKLKDGFCMNGLLDDIRIYNRTLTDAEVKAISSKVSKSETRIH
jgi:tRNA A-37 threonylcarbamoyl transferase component Bud32